QLELPPAFIAERVEDLRAALELADFPFRDLGEEGLAVLTPSLPRSSVRFQLNAAIVWRAVRVHGDAKGIFKRPPDGRIRVCVHDRRDKATCRNGTQAGK